MTPLQSALEDYLTIRRALGHKLQRAEKLLSDFVGYVEAGPEHRVTIELAIAWATLPSTGSTSWWAIRLSAVRGFATYLHALEPTNEAPPTSLLPTRYHRAVPYLYSDKDVIGFIGAAETLGSPLRVLTYRTLIGLLAVTGMRVGEALQLDRTDLDHELGLLTVREGKFGKSRELPLHLSSIDALRAYPNQRDRLHPKVPAMFISRSGARLLCGNVNWTVRCLIRRAGHQAALECLPPAPPRSSAQLRRPHAPIQPRRRRRIYRSRAKWYDSASSVSSSVHA